MLPTSAFSCCKSAFPCCNFCHLLLQLCLSCAGNFCLSLLQLLPFLYWYLPVLLAATFAFAWCSVCLSLLAACAILCCRVTKTRMQHKAAPVPARSSTSLPEALLPFQLMPQDLMNVMFSMAFFLACLLASLFACRLHDASLLCRSALTHQWAAP